MPHGIRRALILGHSGFIGSRLLTFLRDDTPELEVIGSSYPPVDLATEDGAASVAPLFTPTTAVVMCSGIKKQLGDNLEIFSKNIAMVMNVCRILDDHPVSRFVYFSSAEVYGEAVENTSITEDTPIHPSSYYGIAKYASEGLLRKAMDLQNDGSLLVVRPALVYGPDEEGAFYGPSGFARALLAGEAVTLWGDGEELREFVYLDDAVRAVAGLVFHEYDGVVNIVGGVSRTFRDIVEAIGRLAPVELDVGSRPRTKPKVDQAYDNTRLKELLPGLGFTSLEEGVRRVIDAERAGQRDDGQRPEGNT